MAVKRGRTRGFQRTGDGVTLSLGLQDLPGGVGVAKRGPIVEAEDGGQVQRVRAVDEGLSWPAQTETAVRSPTQELPGCFLYTRGRRGLHVVAPVVEMTVAGHGRSSGWLRGPVITDVQVQPLGPQIGPASPTHHQVPQNGRPWARKEGQ